MNEQGNAKVALGLVIFSFFSFVMTFGTIWIALIGFENPFEDKGAELTGAELARADSLRAAELAMQQKIIMLQEEAERLALLRDSLNTEISSRQDVVKKLESEIARLAGQVGGEGKERIGKLAGIVAGLDASNLKTVTNNLDVDLLVTLVLNASSRKARVLMNAMDPARAAQVAEKVARIRNLNENGG
ncbi:MAG TPA: hypothetical protein ENJ29_14185 [Bacteroidetes bacterium]|nr:hypothetical protein [Bacteroidota bacterium]